MVRYPSARASGTSATAMCTPPKITRRGWRGNTSRNTLTGPAVASSETVALPSRPSATSAASRTCALGQVAETPVRPSVLEDAELTHRHRGPSRTVATTSPPGPRAAARTSGAHARLDEHLDGPAAREPHLPSALVAHAERDELGRPTADRLADLDDGRALDAASRHRAGHVPSGVASIEDPSGRGAEPHTLVTTARPSGRPRAARRS